MSPTLECQDKINKRREEGKKVYNFGLGANPLKQSELLINLVKKYSHKKEYTSCSGIDELQTSLRNYYSTDIYKIKDILTGNGLKELLFIFQLGFPGKIIHITPSWVSYREQLTLINKLDKLIEIPTYQKDNYKIDFKYLVTLLEKHKNEQMMIILNNPNNPTGVAHDYIYLKELSLILKKYNIIVLADEIYLNVVHNNTNIHSISRYLPKQTILGSSLSKDLACGGYRLGWLLFPPELEYLYNICKSLSLSIYSCPNAVIQYATAEFLKEDNRLTYNQYLYDKNEIFKNNMNIICNTINNLQNKKERKIRYTNPNSSWYIFLNFIEYEEELKKLNINDSKDLSTYLLNNHGIVTVPGVYFNTTELSIRLSLIDFDENLDISRMIEGLNELFKFIDILE